MAGIILTDNEYGSQLAKTLNLLRIEQKWTDCCLETRSGKVHVHHIVLAAVVERLQITSLILSGSKHTFLLKDFNIHIVETFITYLYTGNLHLSSEIDIREFVKLCKHLKFSTLLSHKKFQKYLSSENIDHYSVDISDEDTKLNISETDIKPDDVPYPMYITSNQSFLASTNQIIDNASHVGKSSVPLPHSSEVSEAVPVMSPHPVPTTSSVEEHLIPSNSRSINSGKMTEINTEQSDIEMHIKQEVMSDENYSTLDINTCYEKSQDTEMASVSSIDNQNTQSANELNPEENKNTAKHLTSHLEKNISSSTLSPSDHKNAELLVPGLEPDKMETSQGEVESVHCTDEIKIEIESDSENTMKMEIEVKGDSIADENADQCNVEKESDSEQDTDGQKTYRCEQCGFTTKWAGSMYRHRRIHSDINFRCDFCPAKFQYKNGLQDHLNIKHGDGLLCSHCCKKFTSRSGLSNHLKTVAGMLKYSCEFCGKTFLQKQHYDGHLNSHLQYKPHECEKCGKTFTYKQNLKQHTDICGRNKETNTEVQLRRYQCEICIMEFSSAQALSNHNVGKHGSTFYSCKVCCKSYRWKSSYYRHIKQHE